tara:strand:- start:13256 stop:13777 length:522 start_codon:yes stop_codon:yes gene_type:complete
MNLYRDKIHNRQRSKDPLERRMDQWFETGRQFVDGVAGNRPGQRRRGKTISSGLDNVGRWVEDKIDWFLEEEDDWMEPHELEQEEKQMTYSSSKRPLEAISLRANKSLESAQIRRESDDQNDLWPDESTFRVNKWQRQASEDMNNAMQSSTDYSGAKKSSNNRPLPRSSRRRN